MSDAAATRSRSVGRTTALLVGGAIFLGITGAGLSPASAQGDPQPTVEAPPGPLELGTQIVVGGSGWEPRSAVKVEICGNGATNGSNDCNQPASTIFGVWDDGTLHAPLVVASPPRPCPCVIKVWTITSSVAVTAPITIEGVTDVPIVVESPLATGESTLVLVSATVEDEGGIGSWFGAASPKVLVVTVDNTGAAPMTSPLLNAAWGGGDVDRIITSPPTDDDIAPGEERTYRVPFEVDALSFGDVQVSGAVGIVGNRADFTTTTSTFPWGLLLLVVIASQVLVFGGRALQRRRHDRRFVADRDAALASLVVAPEPVFDPDAGLDAFVAAVLAHSADEPDVDPGLLDAVADAGSQVDDATRNAAIASAYRSVKASSANRDHYLAVVDALDRCEDQRPAPPLSGPADGDLDDAAAEREEPAESLR